MTSPEDGAPAPTTGSRHRAWMPWLAVSAVLVVVAAVLAVILLSSSGDTAGSDYEAKLDTILRPVVTANRSVSRGLATVHGTNPADAESAVATAQAATLTARGGVDALTAPSGSAQLARNARSTLTRETSYLAAVKEALLDPASGSAEQTQTLASNLTNALDVVAPAGEDWSSSVSGADALTAWAPRAAAAIRRRHARRAQTNQGGGGSPSPSGAPTSGSTNCGGGLYAGPNTSCPFAENVRSAYYQAPGASTTVDVYSPVTHQTYSMSCAPAGDGITCSGANNASVTWIP